MHMYTVVQSKCEIDLIRKISGKWEKDYVFPILMIDKIPILYLGHRFRDRMVVGFTTTYPISAYHD
jgi:hypothetical protein